MEVGDLRAQLDQQSLGAGQLSDQLEMVNEQVLQRIAVTQNGRQDFDRLVRALRPLFDLGLRFLGRRIRFEVPPPETDQRLPHRIGRRRPAGLFVGGAFSVSGKRRRLDLVREASEEAAQFQFAKLRREVLERVEQNGEIVDFCLRAVLKGTNYKCLEILSNKPITALFLL